MGWKETRNENLISPKTINSGICRFCGKQAEVTSFFRGSIECKTDSQETYRFKGYKCSLQEEKGSTNPACIDECPLIQKDFL